MVFHALPYQILLLPQDLLDLSDLFLNFAGSLFVLAFGFQIGIHADFPGDLLDLALHFVNLAFVLPYFTTISKRTLMLAFAAVE